MINEVEKRIIDEMTHIKPILPYILSNTGIQNKKLDMFPLFLSSQLLVL